MQCFECALRQELSEAVAICHQCGAAVCVQHSYTGAVTLRDHSSGMGPSTRPTPARRISCVVCHAAESSRVLPPGRVIQ